MIVLSLFDGISCGRIALERAGIPITKYYSSEIDKHAIAISMHNYPDIVRLGDVTNWQNWNIEKPDLIIGGSPCQSFSISGNRTGFEGSSGLFYYYRDIVNHFKPKYFLLENVVMKKEWEDHISDELKETPIMIDSALVSAQSRKRLYWSNIPNITQPRNKNIYLKDILESGYTDRDKAYCIDANYYKGTNLRQYIDKNRRQIVFEKPKQLFEIGRGGQGYRVYDTCGKSITLTAVGGGLAGKTGLYLTNEYTIRKLTIKECERLQTLPEGYCDNVPGVSNTQKYKGIGNGWTVDVIAHILKGVTQ